ncbi:MAG: flagellar basal body L-ring protein FlgH [Pseudomonadota bacterium]
MIENAPTIGSKQLKSHAGTSGRFVTRVACLGLALAVLGGCNALQRLADVGEEPKLTPVTNPTKQPGYQPVTLPMPAPELAERAPNSLWRPGARAFFRDQRGSRVGDIVTVNVQINDNAALENDTTRARDNTETLGVPSLLGFETQLNGWLPRQFDPTNAVNIAGETDNSGTGAIDRSEQINLRVAAIILQVLPNGNLVLHGRQEVRVNFEVRELEVAGVVRPSDIDETNSIRWDQIAEARIAYGGRGTLSDFQQPRYGTQILDIILPF